MKLRTGAVALFLLLGITRTFAASATLDPQALSKSTLDTGMQVLVKEDHAIALVSLDIWVRNGSRLETPQNNGVSHFIEHMLFKGTAKRGVGQVDREIEDLGGSLGAATSKDWTHFYTIVSSKYLDSALEVMADTLTNPTFPAAEMEKERSVILEENSRNDTLPATAAFSLLSGAAYSTHPYKMPITGSTENVNRLKREDLASYFREHYRPSNMVVIVVGDVKASDAIGKVKAAFAAARGAQAKVEPAPKPVEALTEPAQTEVRRVVADVAMRHSYLMVGFHAPGVRDIPDVYSMDLLMTVLGDNGRGRLATRLAPFGIRGKDIQTDYLTQRDPGLITVLVLLPDLSKADQVEAAIVSEFGSLATTAVPDSELALAKALLLGEYTFANETYVGQSATLGFYTCIQDDQFASSYTEAIGSRRAGELLLTATRFFQPQSYTTVLLRAKEKQD